MNYVKLIAEVACALEDGTFKSSHYDIIEDDKMVSVDLKLISLKCDLVVDSLVNLVYNVYIDNKFKTKIDFKASAELTLMYE